MEGKKKISLRAYSEDEIQDGTMGVCLACGAERDCCEPDARNYKCEECGERRVFGLEEALLMGAIELTEEE